MTQVQVTFDEETLRKVLLGDKGAEVLLEKVMNEILQAEMTEHLGARPGEQTDERRGYRNGSYERTLTTRVGSLNLEVPRDRDGTFQTDLFQRYQRSEKALVLTLMQMVVQGVSTRRVKKITTELCGREFSKSTVSRLAQDLDEQVEAWASRSLEQEYPFLMLDAMQLKVRRQKAVRSTTAMLAVGIKEDGQREILGLAMALSETEQGWRRFIRQLKERGLSGVEVATSDAHEGLVQALREAFPGLIWQRCQAHFRRNVIDQTPSGTRPRGIPQNRSRAPSRTWVASRRLSSRSGPRKRAPEANPMEDLWRELKEQVAASLERSLDALRESCRRYFQNLSPQQALRTAGIGYA